MLHHYQPVVYMFQMPTHCQCIPICMKPDIFYDSLIILSLWKNICVSAFLVCLSGDHISSLIYAKFHLESSVHLTTAHTRAPFLQPALVQASGTFPSFGIRRNKPFSSVSKPKRRVAASVIITVKLSLNLLDWVITLVEGELRSGG